MSISSTNTPNETCHLLPALPPRSPAPPTPDEVVAAVATVLQSVYLRRLAWRLDLSEEDLEDVGQNAVVQALVGLHRFDPQRVLLSWVAMVVRNCMYDVARRNYRHPVRSLFDRQGRALVEPVDHHPKPADSLMDSEDWARIDALLSQVPPRVRTVAALRLQGVANNQVARRLGITCSASTRAWNRFTEICRAQLEQAV